MRIRSLDEVVMINGCIVVNERISQILFWPYITTNDESRKHQTCRWVSGQFEKKGKMNLEKGFKFQQVGAPTMPSAVI
jgi:hypothetical protein